MHQACGKERCDEKKFDNFFFDALQLWRISLLVSVDEPSSNDAVGRCQSIALLVGLSSQAQWYNDYTGQVIPLAIRYRGM